MIASVNARGKGTTTVEEVGEEGEEGTSREEAEGMIGIAEVIARGEVEEGIGGTIGEATGMIEEVMTREAAVVEEGEMMEGEDGLVARAGIRIVKQIAQSSLSEQSALVESQSSRARVASIFVVSLSLLRSVYLTEFRPHRPELDLVGVALPRPELVLAFAAAMTRSCEAKKGRRG